jgi:protein TonB
MGSLIRLIIGVPVAGVVTLLLFLLMNRLIFTEELELEEERDALQIVIAEQVEEIQANVRELTIDDVPEVQPPPPPPQIERQAAEQPTEDMSTIVGEIPDFEAPTLSGADVDFNVSDRDAQPLVRIEPQYPMRAAERGVEGSCWVRFDVTPDGVTTNAEVFRCDSSLFQRASLRAVERWRYQPAIQNGTARWRRGVETRFDFQLAE